jgi:hypothetical protein
MEAQAMVEIIWIIEAVRTLASGASLEPLMQKPGFAGTVFWAAAVLPATAIALGVGLHEWGETPLGRWLGARPAEPQRSISEIDADLRKYETWRDLDGDGEPDF